MHCNHACYCSAQLEGVYPSMAAFHFPKAYSEYSGERAIRVSPCLGDTSLPQETMANRPVATGTNWFLMTLPDDDINQAWRKRASLPCSVNSVHCYRISKQHRLTSTCECAVFSARRGCALGHNQYVSNLLSVLTQTLEI